MRDKLIRFMQGRYGNDQLNRFLSVACMILLILSMIVKSGIMYYVAIALLVLQMFRTFSRNIPKRYAENQKYLAMSSKVRYAWAKKKNELKQLKTHHIYRCPGCKQKIRVPRGRGRIEIRCPKCRQTFIKKS
ncbi:MAG: hypothetical protein IKC46_09800 [Lachnospiraceae bacterium]|nr:hypothetical protein [Lachnospiraceae bacterium]